MCNSFRVWMMSLTRGRECWQWPLCQEEWQMDRWFGNRGSHSRHHLNHLIEGFSLQYNFIGTVYGWFLFNSPNVYLCSKQPLYIGMEILQTIIISSRVLLKRQYLWCSATNYNYYTKTFCIQWIERCVLDRNTYITNSFKINAI